MNPHISLPRQHGGPASFGGTHPSSNSRSDGLRMPRFFKRLFKFPQMDFEMAVWEMSSLLLAPKRVFRSIYYHVCPPPFPPGALVTHCSPLTALAETYAYSTHNTLPICHPHTIAYPSPLETKNTWHRPDPSFTYLLSFFLLLTSLAWGLAWRPTPSSIVRLTLTFIFIHFVLVSLLVATAMYFLVGRLLGPGVAGLPGRRRQQGLFTQEQAASELEFGYCFDVAIRAFFPVWVFLYVFQFVLMPLVTKDYWICLLLGNSLYLVALSYYIIITFLGYNALPFLNHTEFLLLPIPVFVVLFFASLFGLNLAKHVAPLLLVGAGG